MKINLFTKMASVRCERRASDRMNTTPVIIKGTVSSKDQIAPYISVYDRVTGNKLSLVRAVNVDEGWCEVFQTTADGHVMADEEGKAIINKKEGCFEIRINQDNKFARRALQCCTC